RMRASISRCNDKSGSEIGSMVNEENGGRKWQNRRHDFDHGPRPHKSAGSLWHSPRLPGMVRVPSTTPRPAQVRPRPAARASLPFGVDITMRLPSRFPRPLAALVALGLLSYLAVPAVSDEPQSQDKAPQAKPTDPEKAKQVAEIEKQIAELNKKLSEIKAGPAGNGNANANAAADKKPVEGVIPDSWAKALQWRCIGPADMGRRIVAMSVVENDPCCYWVATASGGLLKTSNNGITFDHQFDHEGSVSIGDVCVAPSNKEIIYVGTGENNPRNSVSYGDGVYKSTDGGKTWKNVG